MPITSLLIKGVKLAAKGTGFVSLVAAVNMVPIAAYQHFGFVWWLAGWRVVMG